MRNDTKSQTESLSLPHSLEAELATLGVVIYAPETLKQIEFLEPGHFHDRVNAEVFRVIREMAAAGKQPDHITLRAPLEKTISGKDFDTFLHDALSEPATPVNVRLYAERIYDLALRRKLLANQQGPGRPRQNRRPRRHAATDDGRDRAQPS